MLNLDKYIGNSMKIRLFGKEYDILEPTIGMIIAVDRIEEDINAENQHSKRVEVAMLFLNNNRQGKTFSEEDVMQLPYEALLKFLEEVSLLRLEADKNPN